MSAPLVAIPSLVDTLPPSLVVTAIVGFVVLFYRLKSNGVISERVRRPLDEVRQEEQLAVDEWRSERSDLGRNGPRLADRQDAATSGLAGPSPVTSTLVDEWPVEHRDNTPAISDGDVVEMADSKPSQPEISKPLRRQLRHWLFWWRIDQAELARQVAEYDSLGFSESARKISLAFLILSGVMTIGQAYANGMEGGGVQFVGGVAILVLGVFIYRGHRWAMIGAMVGWTVGRGFLLYSSVWGQSTVPTPMVIIYWCVFMHAFFVAFRVEQERRRSACQGEPTPSLRPVPPSPLAKGLSGYTADAESVGSSHRRGYMSRHWRGELSLGISCWVSSLLVVLVAIVAEFVVAIGPDLNHAPRLICLEQAGIAIYPVIAGMWLLIGVWRSAGRSIATRRMLGERAGWAATARVVTVSGVMLLIASTILYVLPYAYGNMRIALGDDDVPPHLLRVLNGGSEVELAGGIGFGTAADLKVLLDAIPQVHTVKLSGPGGYAAEAQRLRDLIQERHLATYTNAECASACSSVFLGGYPRYLGPKGKLGFHRSSLPGVPRFVVDAVNRDFRRELIRAGVTARFADKVLATPTTDMWWPDRTTLLAAGVVTQEVDDSSPHPEAALRGTLPNVAKTESGRGPAEDGPDLHGNSWVAQ